MENMTETSCRAFAEALAPKAPVPGGGGASALAGSLGAALCSMVGNYTLGKPKYAAVEADVRAILEEAERLRTRLLDLVEEDAAAFAPLSRAYGIPTARPGAPGPAGKGQRHGAFRRGHWGCPRLERPVRRLAEREGQHEIHVRPGLCRRHEPGGRRHGGKILENRRRGLSIRHGEVQLMAKLLEGAPVAEALTRQIKEGVDRLRRFGPVPTLAILRVGERPADLSYEKQTRRQCESVGIRVKQFLLPENSPRQELLDAVEAINRDPGVHGCLLFRPLADKDTERAACALLAPEKDVDGVGVGALGAVFAGEGAGFPPCTAQACMEVLDYYQIPIAGKRAAVIGRSLVVGRPVSMLLQQRDATVTICHSKTRDLPGI